MKRPAPPLELLQGTLDLLILRSLVFGEAHGHAISRHIRQASEDLLHVETGSLYPALHRLEKQALLASAWKLSEKGKRAKYYRLTPLGRKHLAAERARWDRMTGAVGGVMNALAWKGSS